MGGSGDLLNIGARPSIGNDVVLPSCLSSSRPLFVILWPVAIMRATRLSRLLAFQRCVSTDTSYVVAAI